MAAAATNSSTFPLFSTLPKELRDQIWREALPGTAPAALYFYKKGCWCPRRLTQADEEYDSENDENNLNFEFRYDLLDDVQVEVPLIFVNSEARHITLIWVREQGFEIRPSEDKQHPFLMRHLDPMRDALYVALDKWDEFLCEPSDRQWQPDLVEKLITVHTDLGHLAVPEVLLRDEVSVAALPDIFWYFMNIKVLFIIVDAQPDLKSGDSFKSTQGEAFFWDANHGRFVFKDTGSSGDDALYRLVGETAKVLCEQLAKNHIKSFEIQPILAIRR